MSEVPSESVINRIRKMLRLAADKGASEGERDNAMRMARSTLAKYNLDMAEVENDSKGPSKSIGEERVEHTAVFFGRPWARAIAVAAAELCFCVYVYVPAKRGKDTRHIFVGRTSNAVTAGELARYLVESVQKEATMFVRRKGLGYDSLRSFAMGAAQAINRRVALLVAEPAAALDTSTLIEATPKGPGTSLAVIQTNEKTENMRHLEKAMPNLQKGRHGQATHDHIARAAGHQYGSTVSLSRQLK